MSTNGVRWVRTRKSNKCPVCGEWGFCEVSADGEYAHCMHVESDHPLTHRLGGWRHSLRLGLEARGQGLEPLKSEAVPTNFEPLNLEEKDKIFRALLRRCPLSAAHRDYLIGEGVPGHLAEKCGTLRYDRAASIARELVERFGESIGERHPALRKLTTKNGRTWWTIASAADGILFPALDLDGRIEGLQIRKDKPLGANDRYRWLSSDGKGGTPITIFTIDDYRFTIGEQEQANAKLNINKENSANSAFSSANSAVKCSHLFITEGWKKGAALVGAWGADGWAAVSLAGVDAYQPAQLLEVIERLNPAKVVLGFDQDKRQNPRVQAAEQKLLRLVAAAFPQVSVYSLEWDGELGKGFDDALKADADFHLSVLLPDKRYVSELPGLVAERIFGAANARKLYTIEEARLAHGQLFKDVLRQPDGRRIAVTSTTGTGKSRAADDAVARMLLDGWLSYRVLLLAPNKANIRERTAPDTLLGQALGLGDGRIAIQLGRHYVEDIATLSVKGGGGLQPLCANSNASLAGHARHAAARIVCRDCPFASDANWEAVCNGTDKEGLARPFKCEEEGYLATRKASAAAQVVIATKEAYLNNSREIEKFDVVICDEELLPYLVESGITISSAVLATWRQRLTASGVVAPGWLKLFEVIEQAIGLHRQSEVVRIREFGDQYRLLPALGILEFAAELLECDLNMLVEQCESEAALNPVEMGRYDAYRFELPFTDHAGRAVIPYRAARSLLNALKPRANPPYFAKQTDGSYALEIWEVRAHLVEALASKRLIVLDSTVPPALRGLLPDLEEVTYRVAQNLRITQITNALYTKRDLLNSRTRELVADALRGFVAGHQPRQHLTIAPQRFLDALITPEDVSGLTQSSIVNRKPSIVVEHWGLHRATNRYSECDSLALVGHHLRPLDEIRAEVAAIRAYRGCSLPLADCKLKSEQFTKQKLRLYNLTPAEDDGYGFCAGRWMQCDADSDVQAAIEHDYTSHIAQAIGRLRAALRPADLPPVEVLILCNEPVGDLPVHELTTAKRLAARQEPEVSENQPTETETETATGSSQKDVFTESNHGETFEKGEVAGASAANLAFGIGGLVVREWHRDAFDPTLDQDETPSAQLYPRSSARAYPPDIWDDPPEGGS
jgi:hypothetical protein